MVPTGRRGDGHLPNVRWGPAPGFSETLVQLLLVCALGHTYRGRSVYKRRPISVLTREGYTAYEKHIDRVLLVGATVVVLLAFGSPSLVLPPSVDYNNTDASQSEQTVPEY